MLSLESGVVVTSKRSRRVLHDFVRRGVSDHFLTLTDFRTVNPL